MADKLKPCPICGDEVRLFTTAGQCPRVACTCGIEFSTPRYMKPDGLVGAWNDRVRPDYPGGEE